jgi:hypothetical protein
MAEILAGAESQPKRKTQRRCGYEVRPASAIRTGLPALRQTGKMNIYNWPDNNVFEDYDSLGAVQNRQANPKRLAGKLISRCN